MVSGRLSLPQSVQNAVHAHSAKPKPDASRVHDDLFGGKAFASYIAPERQEVRSRAQNGESKQGGDAPPPRTERVQEEQSGHQRTEDTEDGANNAGDEHSDSKVDGASQTGASDRDPDGEEVDGSESEAEPRLNESDSDADEAAASEDIPLGVETAEPANETSNAERSEAQSPRGNETAAGATTASEAAKNPQVTDTGSDGESEQSEESLPRLQRRQTATAQNQTSSPAAARSSVEQSAVESGAGQQDGTDSANQTAETTDSQSGGEERKDRSETRAGQARAAAGDEAVSNAGKAAPEKPNFIDSLREDRADQRSEAARTAETTTPRSGQSGAEPIAMPKLDPSAAADRLSGQLHSDRSAISARPEQEAAVSQSVSRGMNAVLRQGGGSLTMKLSPASLGEIRIEMTMQSGKVTVQFDVGSLAAYEAVKGQIGELRQSLEQRGMTVERVEAHISPTLARASHSEGNANQRSGDQSAHSGESQERHDASDGESRGRAGAEDRAEGSERFADDSGDGFGQPAEFEQALNIGLDAIA
jgi:flagellar hook-length control protein FliK